MGILNLTPDSFSDGGQFQTPEAALRQAQKMLAEGASILDLGAESTRPGAIPISENEELSRLLPVLEALKNENAVISIDTTKPKVADECLKRGAHIINDVSGLKDSGFQMAERVRKFGAGMVLMHRRGDSQTMQSYTQYEDVVSEVLGELRESLQIAEQAGIASEQIVIDPGIGFAKTAAQSWEILRHLESLKDLGYPVLLGPSRKSFLGGDLKDRDFATAAVCTYAVLEGVEILRVHEVGATREAVRVAEALKGVTKHVRS